MTHKTGVYTIKVAPLPGIIQVNPVEGITHPNGATEQKLRDPNEEERLLHVKRHKNRLEMFNNVMRNKPTDDVSMFNIFYGLSGILLGLGATGILFLIPFLNKREPS